MTSAPPHANGHRMDQPTWTVRWRIGVSGLLVLHVFAVFAAPWADPPPSSDLARASANRLFYYIKALAIDNGYRFFAPDPGPSNLVRYEIDFADGSTQSWHFPDPQRHWPRLWYHRQFMLSETLAGIYGDSQMILPLERIPEPDRDQARAQLARGEVLKRSVARYLMAQHEGAERIRMFVRTHHIPTPTDMQRGMRLDDEKLYEEFPLGEYTREVF